MYGMTHFTPDVYSAISSMSLLVINTNFTSAFFRLVCLTDPGTGKKYAGSSSFISMPLYRSLHCLFISFSKPYFDVFPFIIFITF